MLKRNVEALFLLLAAACFLTGCSDPEPKPATPTKPAESLPAGGEQSEPPKPEDVTGPDPTPRPVLPQERAVSRYQNKAYRRSSAVRLLQEIANLPDEFAGDLNALLERAAAVETKAPDADTEGLKVKYFRGVNHSHHGLLENGAHKLPGPPPPGTPVIEHCFDASGKLIKVIERMRDGTRAVTRAFIYQDDQPAGMLTFGPKGYSFGDFGSYKKGKLTLLARIDGAGKLMSCQCIFYVNEGEDYSVRYVIKDKSRPVTAQNLALESVHLKGASSLQFNQAGELKDVWHYVPPLPQE